MNWKQFCKAMRAAGWRLSSAQGFFEHKETLKHFNPFNTVFEDGKPVEAWQRYAEKNEIPDHN